MPIEIYRVTPEGQSGEEIAWLCDNQWLLWVQVDALSKWLQEAGAALQPGKYVADIGFCWRRSASAGGPVLAPEVMRRMADLGMSLFLSEYSGFAHESKTEESGASPNQTELHKLAERVNSKESFLEFVAALRADWEASRAAEQVSPSSPYGPAARGWENPYLGYFLEAMQSWTEDMEERVPAAASWRTFADMLYAAKIYE